MPLLFVGGRMGCGNRIQVVVSPLARLVRVIWASVDGAVCGGVAEGGVGDVLDVGVGDASSVVADAPVVSACSVREGAVGGGMVGVALVMTTVWVLWVVLPGMSSRLGGRGLGPSPLLAEGLVGTCGWLVCRSLWCWPPLVSGHALATLGGGRRYCRCR